MKIFKNMVLIMCAVMLVSICLATAAFANAPESVTAGSVSCTNASSWVNSDELLNKIPSVTGTATYEGTNVGSYFFASATINIASGASGTQYGAVVYNTGSSTATVTVSPYYGSSDSYTFTHSCIMS